MYKAPRGTEDILPAEQPYWRFVEAQAEAVCRSYGYQRIETPMFEEAGLFERGVGAASDIVEKEMYTFPDRSGDLMTLRPEGTAPVCRAYLEHGMAQLPQPVRLYYLGPAFRYERPQAGRFRQHHQLGVEALGEADPALDAEVISLAWDLFQRLGLMVGAPRSIGAPLLKLNSIGCSQCRPRYIAELRANYSGHVEQLCTDCRSRLERNPLRLLDCKQPGCQAVAGAVPRSLDHLCHDCRQHFDGLQVYLKALAFPYSVDHRLVRGLDYYTRTVFEVQPVVEGAQSTMAGGGRYDGLVEAVGGKPTPAVGFAAGLERIILNLKRAGVHVPDSGSPVAFMAHLGPAAKERALLLAGELRRRGITVVAAWSDRSLRAQLRQANSVGARYALILGDAELASGSVVVRDMATGEQQTVPQDQVGGRLAL
ncbi:MAG: histidine--tRNA ligase [Chloroflexi bacterium]|nr:histidine--tRNA ligase [Chloroflexota bacterium]